MALHEVLKIIVRKVAMVDEVDLVPSLVYWRVQDCPKPSLHDYEIIEVRRYLENTTECRRKMLLKYFDLSFATHGEINAVIFVLNNGMDVT